MLALLFLKRFFSVLSRSDGDSVLYVDDEDLPVSYALLLRIFKTDLICASSTDALCIHAMLALDIRSMHPMCHWLMAEIFTL